MDPLKVLKKVVPQQHYFCQFSQILTKVMLLWNDFFLNFQWIHWSEMTLLYLNFEVWGVTDSAFSISGSNCSHTAVLCHFPCFFAQLSPPATINRCTSQGWWWHFEGGDQVAKSAKRVPRAGGRWCLLFARLLHQCVWPNSASESFSLCVCCTLYL